MKTDSKSKRGRLARASGARFELKVRAELENDGWTVTKWMNNIEARKIIPAKIFLSAIGSNSTNLTSGNIARETGISGIAARDTQ